MEFTTQHFIALAPMLITTVTTVVVMLAIAWKRNHSQTFLLSTVGLNLALLSILPALKVAPLAVTSLVTIDKFACLYMAIIRWQPWPASPSPMPTWAKGPRATRATVKNCTCCC